MSGLHGTRATVVGAGPVACLVAIELRERGFEVSLYERGPDIRQVTGVRGHSFNLTLTKRGLDSLEPDLVELLYRNGIPLPQRVIHHADGSISYQPYSVDPDHHLLSIPRVLLHRALLDEAERRGARLFFRHECVAADPVTGGAMFVAGGASLTRTEADLLIGCDGANSTVRHEMSRRGARMRLSQEYVHDGFVEILVPAAPGGGHCLLERLRDPTRPESLRHGLHVWPRGEFMLLAQPNIDGTYTAGLWMPWEPGDRTHPCWDMLRTPADVHALFREHFADLADLAPSYADDVLKAPPAPLKTVRCGPYHHGRAVLFGDSAHTLVPFFGQGINCSFEDVRTFFAILDRNLADREPEEAVAATLPEYTERRRPAGETIADLSLAMAAELKQHSDDAAFHARKRLEKRLHQRHPDLYVPLYQAIAFTGTPYHEVVARHERHRAVLDDLCRRYDPATQEELIVAQYAAAVGADAPGDDARGCTGAQAAGAGGELELSPAEQRDLLEAVSARLADYHEELAKRNFPASYPGARSASGGVPDLTRRLPPRTGTPLEALLDEVFEEAMPSGMMHAHPGFLAHVPSGGLFQAAVGEFVTRSLNRFAGAWAAAPGFARIEADVIGWFCSALGYGEGSFGYLTTGGSIANFMALRCALERVPEGRRHEATVYVSEQGHFSVSKAARLAGIASSRVRAVPTDGAYRMDMRRLREMLARDLREGAPPGCVVATAGTTNTGAVDDLRAAARLCREHGVWLHVDACFGGFFRLTGRGRALLAGIEAADSIAVDAHKSLFLPHGSSALLVRDKAALKAAFAVPAAAYIPELSDDEERADFMDYGPEVTREFRGLTAWLPIRMHGIEAFERCLDRRMELADELAARLAAVDGVEVVPRGAPHLPTVAFRIRAEDPAEADLNTERLCERICARGNVYVATTTLPREGRVVRACIMHHRTDELVIDQFMVEVQWALRGLGMEVGKR
ncbi:aminotransferase class V-fold PLP-dependent enzyme [Actinomadura formosensis]|uniref:aminotransferase class V-fold PLP-dependent enzyme n=1 Tax=Actinomadura formosensis TaxID=60706 RepID=UPI000834D4FD|nr:aminotransferase class V-fold PLP-dependent enzyme [Actinomadura formosensis]